VRCSTSPVARTPHGGVSPVSDRYGGRTRWARGSRRAKKGGSRGGLSQHAGRAGANLDFFAVVRVPERVSRTVSSSRFQTDTHDATGLVLIHGAGGVSKLASTRTRGAGFKWHRRRPGRRAWNLTAARRRADPARRKRAAETVGFRRRVDEMKSTTAVCTVSQTVPIYLLHSRLEVIRDNGAGSCFPVELLTKPPPRAAWTHQKNPLRFGG